MFSMPLAPNFVDLDLQAIRAEIKQAFTDITGTSLYPAQVENILLDTFAYREYLLRLQIQYTGEQNLVAYATGLALDNLGLLVGVTRLGQTAATCDIRFTLVSGHGGVVIPAGTRVASVDGRAVFATQSATVVPSGTNTVTAFCVCLQLGTIGNGYANGAVNTLLDPQAYISTVTPPINIIPTAGGAEAEADASLRERIQLSPARFSTAGSYGAYKFFAKGANPAIADVAVTSPSPGTVELFPLMADGSTTPTQILNQVLAAVRTDPSIPSALDSVRPLTDRVLVTAPTRVDYTLQVDLTLYDTADAAQIQTAVRAALQAFVDERRTKLGKDVVDTQVINVAQIEGVYRVELPTFTTIIISPTQFPYCTAINVNITGTTAG